MVYALTMILATFLITFIIHWANEFRLTPQPRMITPTSPPTTTKKITTKRTPRPNLYNADPTDADTDERGKNDYGGGDYGLRTGNIDDPTVSTPKGVYLFFSRNIWTEPPPTLRDRRWRGIV